nr:hypothetical protein [Aneurinibacillus terranovensis]
MRENEVEIENEEKEMGDYMSYFFDFFQTSTVNDILYSPEIDGIHCPGIYKFIIQLPFEKRENHDNSPSITRLTM